MSSKIIWVFSHAPKTEPRAAAKGEGYNAHLGISSATWRASRFTVIKTACSIPPDLHKGVVDQMNRVSRLVSFADSHRA